MTSFHSVIEQSFEPVLIDADNVRRWLDSLLIDGGEYPKHHIGVLPFPYAKIIYRAPVIVSTDEAGKRTPRAGLFGDVSVNCHCLDLMTVSHEGWGDRTRWVTNFDVYLSGRFIGAAMTELDGAGETYQDGHRWAFNDDDFDKETAQKLFQVLAWPAYMTISLLHCKNVALIDKPVTRQARRLAERKGEPVIQYKTLVIEPFKKQVRSEARQAGESEMHRALHICRGHFKEYSEERPLFGKYAGRFWVPMHARGSKEHGEVRKDYKVIADPSPPAEA